jgi:DNA-directed RNA polymerase subunit RPC12/RpoP
MLKIFDFVCPECKKECPDMYVDLKEFNEGVRPECPECGEKMENVLGGMKEKHGSWALWKVSAQGNVD